VQPTTFPSSLFNREPVQNPKFNVEGHLKFIRDNYSIINKDKEEVVFNPNPAQIDFTRWLGKYYNVMVLKSRKLGFSSVALAIACNKFILGRNERCVSMSFDADAAAKQLARAKQFIKSYEEKNSVKIPFKYNSRNEMVWEGVDEQGRKFNNALRVGTAKSTSFGRGDDITFLHLTEVAFCDDVPTLLAGVGEALVRGAHTIFETTANGFNSFKTFWDDAMLNMKDFACLFYSPEWEYDEEYLNKRRARLGRLFEQEYPMTPEQAFIASGQGFFEKTGLMRLLEECKRWEASNVHTV
jgi:hypothetical protein